MITILLDCAHCETTDELTSAIDEVPTETAIVEYFSARGWTITETDGQTITHCPTCAAAQPPAAETLNAMLWDMAGNMARARILP